MRRRWLATSTWALVLAGSVITPALSLHRLRASSAGRTDAEEMHGQRCPKCHSDSTRLTLRRIASVLFCSHCERAWIVAGRSARALNGPELVPV